MNIFLANPRGFCAGVVRAINIVDRVLEIWGPPVYVYHEVVHNTHVVNNLQKKGVIFIENLSTVPTGSILIFSAHGVSNEIRTLAQRKNLIFFDATCPLVRKVHNEVKRASIQGREAILIGHAGHPEVEGTLGQYTNPKGGIYLVESIKDIANLQVKNQYNLCFITQTTLSVYETTDMVNALRHHFPKIGGPRKTDICYATTNRQQAVRKLAHKSDLVLVVGSHNSSNSTRLVEVVQRLGKNAHLIDSVRDIHPEWFNHSSVKSIGITAGASAPADVVNEVIQYFKKFNITKIEEIPGEKENIIFELPKELKNSSY
ncbi:MAG: 4-hydroxy-3-methylbut-2-enyl diphosphate reductase [Candidatus Dasytiphilus stammeri]